MITFTLCLLALIAGYFIYGRFIEGGFAPALAGTEDALDSIMSAIKAAGSPARSDIARGHPSMHEVHKKPQLYQF